MVYKGMAYTVLVYAVMAYIVMVHILMAYIVATTQIVLDSNEPCIRS